MKRIICLFFCTFFLFSLSSQEKFSKFSFSGYQVNVIPSDTFYIDVKNKIDANKKTDNNTFKLTIKDQTGRVPKDTVYIYTNSIDRIYLHNSVLVMKSPLTVDSIAINLVSSRGALDIKANYVSIRAVAGSGFSAKGSTQSLKCSVGARSHVTAKELIAEEASLNVMGHSSLIINSKKITKREVENSSVENVYKEE